MDEIDDIKHRLDIVEVISSYLTLKRAGANMKGLCPFHQEKTPSFMVSPERQTFKCFGCGEGGDVFTFIEKMEGLDFFNALKILADMAGVKLERRSVRYGNKEHKADRKTRLFEINDWAKRLYQKILLEHPKADKARRYLEARGLGLETIVEFEIGYAPDSWDLLIQFLKRKNYVEEEIFQAGAAVRSERGGYYDRFRGRITFPINNIMGHTIGFTSRTLKEDAKEAKYINSSESPIYVKGETIYGLDKAKMAVKEADLAVVVEGNMDVVACHQAGFKNVVASSGTALTERQMRILNRYASELALCFDSDNAGVMAMKRAVTLALQNDVATKIIVLPLPFKDPDEAIKSSPKNWLKAIKSAKPSLEHWIDLLIKQNPDLSVLAKKKIAKEILPVIKLTYSAIEKESYLKYLSQKLAVSERSLIDALEKTRDRPTGQTVKRPTGQTVKRELSVKERVFALIWLEPSLVSLLPRPLNDDFTIPEFKEFSLMIKSGEIVREKVGSDEKSILDQWVMDLGESLDINNPELSKPEFIFLVKRWRNDRQDHFKQEFADKIREAESKGDKKQIKKLLEEYAGLIK